MNFVERTSAILTPIDMDLDDLSSPVDEVVREIKTSAKMRVGGYSKRQFTFASTAFTPRMDVIARVITDSIHSGWDSSLALSYSSYDEKDSVSVLSGEAEGIEGQQLELGVLGGFSPCRRLIEIWGAGLTALGKETGVPFTGASEFELSQIFSSQIAALLGTTGHQLRFKSAKTLAITESLRFLPKYQVQICDAFFIIPDQSAEFLELLRSEIFISAKRGSFIEGDWGRVSFKSSGDLHFDLAAPTFVSDPDFEESEEVE